MKALIYRQFGTAEVLQIEDIPEPKLPDDAVLVNQRATTVNVIDSRSRNGSLWPFVNKKFPKIPGVDVAGVVVAVGRKVKRFQVGDAVFGGTNPFQGGAFAEVVAVSESMLTAKPETLSFDQAAALPIAGLAALQSLRDLGKVKQGDAVLIYGSSGAMGLYAIQLAKQFEAHVTAVCGTQGVSASNLMGADVVIDYKMEPVTFNRGFDTILDLSSKFPFTQARQYLKPEGRFVEPSPTIPKFIGSKLLNPFRRQKHLMLQTALRPDDLALLASLVASGKLKVTIAKIYPFTATKQAFIDMEKGGTVGKIVVSVDQV
jgi:NADPH:quinone reductase-like Zn-dependent oxidoreductase